MKHRVRKTLVALALMVSIPAWSGQVPQTQRAGISVEGAWKLEKIVRPAATVETHGGFLFLDGYYSTAVNYVQAGTQTNISQFGSYSLEGNRLSLVPTVQASSRAQTVIYEPEAPFSLDVTIIGDEMKGVALKDGTTFVFRRLR